MSDLPSRPSFSEVDAWGLTHPGKVRTENQDHFFVGALARRERVNPVGVDEAVTDEPTVERVASLAVVADGVGSARGGGEAARLAVRDLVTAVADFFEQAEVSEGRDPEVFASLLHDAALSCHESLLQRGEKEGDRRRFATTLTLFLGLWPHAYLLQVGDSRCYILRGNRLTQISRDQTLAEELVDQGVLTRTMAENSRWANVLSSAMGGEQAAPVVPRVLRDWGDVVLLCSDGLTKHVPDEVIQKRLSEMTSATQVTEQLLQDALDGGGTDNITVVVGRTYPRDAGA